jgi:glycine hydroxymethyltransferase
MAEIWLGQAGIIVNKNMIPYDERKPMETSGLRIGTPALSTRGMGAEEMGRIAGMIDRVLASGGEKGVIENVRGEALEMCRQFPIWP